MLKSSIVKKAAMALSGLALLGFLVVHLAGNLQIFLGPAALNAYAMKLRKLGGLLWVARLGLLAALLLHIWTSVRLTLENRAARPQPYAVYHPEETTVAARTMMLSGGILFAFVLYHLLHLTFRVAHPDLASAVDAQGHPDVYRMVVASFQRWPIALAYLVGVGAVCLHVSHAVGSSVQTLGFNTERTVIVVMRAGQALAAAIFVGYLLIPASILLGWVR